MFDLVRDVERYPEFLSWVESATVHEQSDDEQLASMMLTIAGMRHEIRTRNRLQPGRSLLMRLDRGPFSDFRGQWRFADLGLGSRVELELMFDFGNPVLAAAFNRGFSSVANRMVDDFCSRAEAIYGR